MNNLLHNLDWVLPIRSEFLTIVFKTLTSLGDTIFILTLLVMVFWVGNRHAGNRLAIIVLTTVLVNWFLKDLWQDPRPDERYLLDGSNKTSFGAPSGHTQIAVVMWLWLAGEIGKRWAWFAAAIIAAGVSFSRLYLGKHDLEDVLAGLVLGLATLILFRWTLGPRFNCWRALSPAVQIGAASAGLAALFYFWPVEPIKGLLVILGGFLIGWLSGVSFLNWKRHDFHRITPFRTVMAGILGLALLGAIIAGLRVALEASGLPETAARILGGLIVGATATGLVPFLLASFKLMRKTDEITS